jgi:hypothetical protein
MAEGTLMQVTSSRQEPRPAFLSPSPSLRGRGNAAARDLLKAKVRTLTRLGPSPCLPRRRERCCREPLKSKGQDFFDAVESFSLFGEAEGTLLPGTSSRGAAAHRKPLTASTHCGVATCKHQIILNLGYGLVTVPFADFSHFSSYGFVLPAYIGCTDAISLSLAISFEYIFLIDQFLNLPRQLLFNIFY